MEGQKRRWVITADKFLTKEQVSCLNQHLLNKRDLALARGNDPQAIKDYYMLRTLLESGLRVFEFTALALSDFNGQKLSVRHGKGDKPRTVLLTKATSIMLKEWLLVRGRLGFATDHSSPLFPSRYGTKYTTRGIQRRVELIFSSLGFPANLTTHSCRHTYCSFLLESGKVGLPTVKENMGHSSIATTNIYSHAVVSLDDVELYPDASSQISVKSELQGGQQRKKANSSVNAYLRSVNFKLPVR